MIPRRLLTLAAATLLSGCSDAAPVLAPTDASASARPPAGTTVSAVVPSSATRDTTLDVTITGSGFDQGSKATFELRGAVDPRVRVNSTRYVKSTQLVASVTIDAAAELELYDAVVTTSKGTKGIGTEMLEVVLGPELLSGGTHAYGVNASGDAVGNASNPDAACPFSSVPLHWSESGQGTALPLGDACGGSAKAINASGVILGYVRPEAAGENATWTPGVEGYTLQLLPRLADGAQPVVTDINDLGDVVAWSQTATPGVYVWSADQGWRSVAVPAGTQRCVANTINNAKAIAGYCRFGDVSNPYYWASPESAPVALPRPALTGDVNARDMNGSGTIVGYAYQARRAIKWAPNGSGGFDVSILDDQGGAAAMAISESGVISGGVYKSQASSGPIPAYWLPDGSLRTLSLGKSGEWGEALCVADTPAGPVIVGHRGNTQALRWREQ